MLTREIVEKILQPAEKPKEVRVKDRHGETVAFKHLPSKSVKNGGVASFRAPPNWEPMSVPTQGGLLLFLPEPHHAEAFARSGRALRTYSPGYDIPGIVGALGYDYHPPNPNRNLPAHFSVQYIEGGFRSGQPEELTRDVAEQYADWQKHLFRALFEQAEARGIGKVSINLETAQMTPRLKRLFAEEAKRRGYGMTQTKYAHAADKTD